MTNIFCISLPKCATSTLADFFKSQGTIHEKYNSSFFSALKISESNSNSRLLQNYLKKRFSNQNCCFDTSGYLHSVQKELFTLFPNHTFLRIVRSPSTWIPSYLEMLNEKKDDLYINGKHKNQGSYLFEYFYLNRICRAFNITDLEKILHDENQLSKIIDQLASYWMKSNLALSDNRTKVITWKISDLTQILSSLQGKNFYTSNTENVISAQSVHSNISKKTSLRLIVENHIKEYPELVNESEERYELLCRTCLSPWSEVYLLKNQ